MLGFRHLQSSAGMGLSLLILAACTSTPETTQYSGLPAHMQLGYDSKGRVVTNYKVGTPYEVAGKWYYPSEDYGYREEGIASWYGPGFHGKRTANGEVYDMNALTAAHKTLPMPSVVQVTNLENGRSMRVRINDRGPFVDDRIIDLSRRSAQLLGVEEKGLARVLVEFVPDESLTLKNMAMNEAGGFDIKTPDIKAAPRGSVVAEPLAPPTAGPSTPSVSRPTIDPPRATANVQPPQPPQPTIRQASLPSPSTPSASVSAPRPTVTQASPPSVASRPAVSTPTPSAPAPTTIARAPSPQPSTITRSSLPSPQTAPPPVSAPSPSVGASTGSGINLPSVSVNTPDLGSMAKSAAKSQMDMQSAAKDMLPSPKEVLQNAMENRQQQNQIEAQSQDPNAEPELDRLQAPENIDIPDGVFIQAGSFSDLNNARRLEAQLSELGNVFVAMVDVGGQIYHRVRVGPLPDRSIADQLLQYMQTEGYGEARIVSE